MKKQTPEEIQAVISAMPIEIQIEMRMTRPMKQHIRLKCHHRFKRIHREKFKTRDKIRNATYQKTCDSFKKNWKKKGEGRAVKIKGETLPSRLPLNDPISKSWTVVGGDIGYPLKHGMKIDAIWEIT